MCIVELVERILIHTHTHTHTYTHTHTQSALEAAADQPPVGVRNIRQARLLALETQRHCAVLLDAWS
jgi:hypothetical protein